jgi:hypothetical protein
MTGAGEKFSVDQSNMRTHPSLPQARFKPFHLSQRARSPMR